MLEASHNELVFKIEEDLPEVWAYLYVFRGHDCIYDYLQDSVDICKKQAKEEFGVPLGAWEKT